MKFRLSLVLLLTIVTVPSVQGQGFSLKSLEVSASEAVSSYTTKAFQIGPPQSSSPISYDMKLKTDNRHEFKVNVLTTNRFGGEGFFEYGKSSVVFRRLTEPADSLSIPLDIHHFGTSLLYYPIGTTKSKWRPFVRFGAGAMIYRPTEEGQRIATDPLRGNLSTFVESSRAAVNVGGGIKWSLSRAFGLRFDAGSVITSVPTFGLQSESDDPNVAVLPLTGRSNNLHASVGIIFYLGR